MMKPRARAKLPAKALAVWALSCRLMAQVPEGETNAPPAEAQALTALTAQLQEQHKATMWFLDQLRQNIQDTTKERDQALADSVQHLEQTFATQARSDVAWIERAHWLTVVTAGCVGGMALVVMVLTLAGMCRAISRRVELVAAVGSHPGLAGRGPPEADSGGAAPVTRPSSVEQADRRLLLAIERLERRVAEMENHAASLASSTAEDWGR